MNQENKSKKRRLLIVGIIVLLILLLLLILALTRNKTYQVNFYDCDNLLGSYTLDKDERITKPILDEVLAKVPATEIEYIFEWSYKKDVVDKVDFETLDTDSDIYLHKTEKEFEINVEKNDLFDYEIITDGKITQGSTIKFVLNNKADVEKYQIKVFVNGQEIIESLSNQYIISNVNSDLQIQVKYTEILTIKSLLKDTYEYTGEALPISYSIVNKENQILNIPQEELRITILDSNNKEVSELIQPDTYTIRYQYLGDKYYIEDLETKVTINKQVLTIKDLLDDTYIYTGQVIIPTYQILDSHNNIVDLKDIKITIYNSNNQEVSKILSPDTYMVQYQYLGSEYQIEDVVKVITVKKQKLFIEALLDEHYIYSGIAIKTDYRVVDESGKQVNLKDIKVTYLDGSKELSEVINAGRYKVKYQYTGLLYQIDDLIVDLIIEKATPYIIVPDKVFTYNQTSQGLKESDVMTNSNGRISFVNNNNIDVGTYEVTIKVGETINHHSVSTKAQITIQALNIQATMFKQLDDVIYNGSPYTPVVEGVNNNVSLILNKDYEVTYQNNTSVGIAQVIIKGINNYQGEVILTFNIMISDFERVIIAKTEIEELYQTLPDKFKGLSSNGCKITYLSTSTGLSIDSSGNITVNQIAETQLITVYVLITYNDAAIYTMLELEVPAQNVYAQVVVFEEEPEEQEVEKENQETQELEKTTNETIEPNKSKKRAKQTDGVLEKPISIVRHDKEKTNLRYNKISSIFEDYVKNINPFWIYHTRGDT